MRALLTGTEACGIDEAARALRSAGHETLSCVDGTREDQRCNGCGDGPGCPTLSGIDVIVAVRAHPLPHLTKQEQLVDCALLTEVPLVVAGSTVLNPYGSRATHIVEGLDAVIDACEAVASACGRTSVVA